MPLLGEVGDPGTPEAMAVETVMSKRVTEYVEVQEEGTRWERKLERETERGRETRRQSASLRVFFFVWRLLS